MKPTRTMKAALLETEGQVVLTEVEMPTLTAPDQVLVQVKTVGICGSEVHAFQGTHPYRKAPTILGHEAAGVVAEVGEAVAGYAPGDRVIIDPQWTCGACEFCRNGDINLCPEKVVMGTPAWPGAFGAFVIAPQDALFHLPDSLTYVQGSLLEPLTVGVHVARRAGLQAGESVAILGAGSIGGLLAGVCHAWGAGPIVVADVRQHCLDVAMDRLGATHAVLLPDRNLVETVREVGGGSGVDVVFCTADDPDLVSLGIDMLKRRGRIVFVALMVKAPAQIEVYTVLSKELSIIGSSMSNHGDVRAAIELAAAGQVDLDAVATHVLPLEQAQRGMELARTKKDGAIKVLLSL